MTIRDQRSDTSRAVIIKLASHLCNQNLADEAVRIALSDDQPHGRGKVVYASESRKMFPLGSAEDVLLSRVYFTGQREKLAEKEAAAIDDRIAAYETLYGLDMDCTLKPAVKVAAEEPQSAQLLEGFSVSGEEELVKSGEAFSQHYLQLNIDDRLDFSKEYVKTASEWGVSDKVPDVIAAYAGEAACDPQLLKQQLVFRKAAALRTGTPGTEYAKLAELLEDVDLASASQEEKMNLAEAIHGLDTQYGFTKRAYDRRMPDAYRIVFNTIKKAEEDAASPSDKAADKSPSEMTKADIIARFGDGALEELESENGDIDYGRLTQIISLFGERPNADA